MSIRQMSACTCSFCRMEARALAAEARVAELEAAAMQLVTLWRSEEPEEMEAYQALKDFLAREVRP